MTAATGDLSDPATAHGTPLFGGFVQAGFTTYQGWHLMRDATGLFLVATEQAGLLPGGFVDRRLLTAAAGNNTDLVNVRTGKRLVNMVAGDTFTAADGPRPLYGVNNLEFGRSPTNATTGAQRSIAGLFLCLDDEYPLTRCLAIIGPEGAAMAAALQASQATGQRDVCRGVFTAIDSGTTYASGILTGPANTALSAQDGITAAVGDVFWAQKGQANLPAAAQVGPWQILALGSVSSQWMAVRPWWYGTGSKIPVEFQVKIGPEGTGTTPAFANTTWRAFCPPGKVVDTDDPLFWPQFVSGSYTASAGVLMNAVSTFPIRSTTLSSIRATNQGTASHASTVGPPRVTAVTAGQIGTSSLTMKAESAPGTTNASDVGVYTIAVTNW